MPVPVADLVPPPDGYQSPDWLRYMWAIYFEGFPPPPIYPHLDEFDAERLVKIVLELGGDTLRFQPIGFWACYPTKSGYPIHPELGKRALLAETVRACRHDLEKLPNGASPVELTPSAVIGTLGGNPSPHADSFTLILPHSAIGRRIRCRRRRARPGRRRTGD